MSKLTRGSELVHYTPTKDWSVDDSFIMHAANGRKNGLGELKLLLQ